MQLLHGSGLMAGGERMPKEGRLRAAPACTAQPSGLRFANAEGDINEDSHRKQLH